MIDTRLLQQYAAEYGLTVDDATAKRFDRYAELLVEWNQKMNLTAITDPVDIVLKHFTDCLTAVPLLPETKGISLIDVGTGAGFPGVPLAIFRPDVRVTLLDSLNKRLIFLQNVCDELGLQATLVHARAEEGGRRADLRERFDVATARAVAALPTLCEYCLPFVKVGGRFVAMKGPDSDVERQEAAAAIRLLGGHVSGVQTISLPAQPHDGIEQQERRLFVIEKKAATPSRFPRQSAKIAKEPLR